MSKFVHDWFDYGIRSTWMGRLESPASIGAKFIGTVDALSRLDPLLTHWSVGEKRNESVVSLAEARERIADIVEGNVAPDDFGESSPVYGYQVTAITDGVQDSNRTTFMVDAGGQRRGETWLQFGGWKAAPDPAMLTYPFFKSALLAINNFWLPPWACAYAFRLDYSKVPLFAGAPLFPSSIFHIPWIAYLSASYIVRFSVPSEILVERAPDGGLLMTATEERFDPINPEHLRRARIIANILIKRTGRSPK